MEADPYESSSESSGNIKRRKKKSPKKSLKHLHATQTDVSSDTSTPVEISSQASSQASPQDSPQASPRLIPQASPRLLPRPIPQPWRQLGISTGKYDICHERRRRCVSLSPAKIQELKGWLDEVVPPPAQDRSGFPDHGDHRMQQISKERLERLPEERPTVVSSFWSLQGESPMEESSGSEDIVGAIPHTSGAIRRSSGAISDPSGAYPLPSGAYPHPSGAYPHPRDAYPDPRDAYPDPRDAYPDPRDAYPDPRDAYPDPRDAYPDPRDAYPDPRDAYPHPSGAFPHPSGAFPHPSGAFPQPSVAFPQPSVAFPQPSVARRRHFSLSPTKTQGLPNWSNYQSDMTPIVMPQSISPRKKSSKKKSSTKSPRKGSPRKSPPKTNPNIEMTEVEERRRWLRTPLMKNLDAAFGISDKGSRSGILQRVELQLTSREAGGSYQDQETCNVELDELLKTSDEEEADIWIPQNHYSVTFDQANYTTIGSISHTVHLEEFSRMHEENMFTPRVIDAESACMYSDIKGVWFRMRHSGHNKYGNVAFDLALHRLMKFFLLTDNYKIYLLEIYQSLTKCVSRFIIVSDRNDRFPSWWMPYKCMVPGGPWYTQMDRTNKSVVHRCANTIRGFSSREMYPIQHELEFFFHLGDDEEFNQRLYSKVDPSPVEHQEANNGENKCQKYRTGRPEYWTRCPTDYSAQETHEMIS